MPDFPAFISGLSSCCRLRLSTTCLLRLCPEYYLSLLSPTTSSACSLLVFWLLGSAATQPFTGPVYKLSHYQLTFACAVFRFKPYPWHLYMHMNLSDIPFLMHPSIFYTRLIGLAARGLEPIPAVIGRRGTPWTCRQSITGSHRDKRDKQPHTRSHSPLRTILETPIKINSFNPSGQAFHKV